MANGQEGIVTENMARSWFTKHSNETRQPSIYTRTTYVVGNNRYHSFKVAYIPFALSMLKAILTNSITGHREEAWDPWLLPALLNLLGYSIWDNIQNASATPEV